METTIMGLYRVQGLGFRAWRSGLRIKTGTLRDDLGWPAMSAIVVLLDSLLRGWLEEVNPKP